MATASTPADPPDAAALAARAATGDQDAWRDLVERYARRVYALVRSRTGRPELAEEVTQSVFVTIAEQLAGGRYREEGRFEAWLFRIAMNRLRDERRATRRRANLLGDYARDHAAPARETPARDGADTARLRVAVAGLSDADREIIALRHHAGMEFKAIARTLGEPLGTVLARHHRALKKLRQILTDHEATP